MTENLLCSIGGSSQELSVCSLPHTQDPANLWYAAAGMAASGHCSFRTETRPYRFTGFGLDRCWVKLAEYNWWHIYSMSEKGRIRSSTWMVVKQESKMPLWNLHLLEAKSPSTNYKWLMIFETTNSTLELVGSATSYSIAFHAFTYIHHYLHQHAIICTGTVAYTQLISTHTPQLTTGFTADQRIHSSNLWSPRRVCSTCRALHMDSLRP